MKKIIKNYYAPTPKKWRKIGDALLGMSLFAQTQEAFTVHTNFMTCTAIIGLIGKFLTNFFSENIEN